jgi:pimeloyl-ACP methyl ester carboxylesterase
MRDGRGVRTWLAAATVALATIGVSGAQDQDRLPQPEAKPAANPRAKDKDKDKKDVEASKGRRKGTARAPRTAPKKGFGRADPLAKIADQVEPTWPFHYRLRIAGADGSPLAAAFYPSRAGANAAVVMLIHERGAGHSSKEFDDPIEGLKGDGLAEHLQKADYAVLAVDLRGHGANPRRERELSAREWSAMVGDLQAAYLFLVDRHNRRELNLAKMGVIAIGEAANLAAAWAASPGAAVSSEGRITDLAGLVLVSPASEAQGLLIGPAVGTIAPRIPILLLAGDREAELAATLKPTVERQRLSKVVHLKTPLRGTRLVRYGPKAAETLTKYLEEPVKFRSNAEWEPRYLLTPIAYDEVQVVAQDAKPAAEGPAGPDAKSKAKAVPEPKSDAKKAKDQ